MRGAGRRREGAPANTPAVALGDSPDWLRNVLTVSGPAAEVARLRVAARGTGAVPWALDLQAEEERLFAPMATGGPAARALARELRESIAARHDRVLAHWADPGACPLDLHRLIPVPGSVLALGDDHPEAQLWLRNHWGVTQPLRHTRILEENADRRLRRSARVVFDFFSADWTPWQAIRRLRADFPRLVLVVEPRYDDG